MTDDHVPVGELASNYTEIAIIEDNVSKVNTYSQLLSMLDSNNNQVSIIKKDDFPFGSIVTLKIEGPVYSSDNSKAEWSMAILRLWFWSDGSAVIESDRIIFEIAELAFKDEEREKVYYEGRQMFGDTLTDTWTYESSEFSSFTIQRHRTLPS